MLLEDCPVARTLSFIGGKWKPLILFNLKGGSLRSAELGRRIPQATTKMLTQQVRELEQASLVRRQVYPEVPPRVEYSLTALGESLRPVLEAMAAWGDARR